MPPAADGLGIILRQQEVAVVVAVQVGVRRVQAAELRCHLGQQHLVCLPVLVIDALAQFSDQVRAIEVQEMIEQLECPVAPLGQLGLTVVNVGDDGDFQVRHVDGLLERKQIAASLMTEYYGRMTPVRA